MPGLSRFRPSMWRGPHHGDVRVPPEASYEGCPSISIESHRRRPGNAFVTVEQDAEDGQPRLSRSSPSRQAAEIIATTHRTEVHDGQ
jgi:hypothetical protein